MVRERLEDLLRERRMVFDPETELATAESAEQRPAAGTPSPTVLETRDLGVYYGHFQALRSTYPWPSPPGRSPPSSALRAAARARCLRCFNRMNDLIPSFRAEGEVLFEARTSTTRGDGRRWTCAGASGWCSRSPTPSPSPIYENVAFGAQDQRLRRASWTRSWSARCGRRRSGTRSRTSFARAPSPFPAGSSSVCASRGRWRSSRR